MEDQRQRGGQIVELSATSVARSREEMRFQAKEKRGKEEEPPHKEDGKRLASSSGGVEEDG